MTLTRQQADDKIFITFPDRGSGWPYWPYLPMKKSNPKGGPDAGTIIDRCGLGKINRDDECFRTVYLMSVWESQATGKPISKAEKKVYNTVDEMIADGWQVD